MPARPQLKGFHKAYASTQPSNRILVSHSSPPPLLLSSSPALLLSSSPPLLLHYIRYRCTLTIEANIHLYTGSSITYRAAAILMRSVREERRRDESGKREREESREEEGGKEKDIIFE